MYLPARIKLWPMKSLYFGVALAMVTTLSISFVIFHSISNRLQQKTIDPAFDRIDELELESARAALISGGPPALNLYLARLDHIFRSTPAASTSSPAKIAPRSYPLHRAPVGAHARTAITSAPTAPRTTSTGSSPWVCPNSRIPGSISPFTS